MVAAVPHCKPTANNYFIRSGNRLEATRIKLRLLVGDARNVGADVAITGSRSTLVPWLKSAGQKLREVQLPNSHSDSPCTAAIFSRRQLWQHAIVLKTRLGDASSTRMANDLFVTLEHALRWPAVNHVLLTPLAWREPQRVAFQMLLALWVFRYGLWVPPIVQRANVEFTIATLDSVEPFEAWLKNDCHAMRQHVWPMLDSFAAFPLTCKWKGKFSQMGFTRLD